ncbi:MAG: hypothetical protein ACK4ND_12065 [Cytophagaceae bacterium]
MKYFILTAVTFGFIFTSCGTQRTCPAYLQNDKMIKEQYTEKGFEDIRNT